MPGRFIGRCTTGVLTALVIVGVTACSDDSTRTSTAVTVDSMCSIDAIDHSGELQITLTAAGPCDDQLTGKLTVTNTGTTTCTSDVMATIGPPAARMWMRSTSGFGGATGTWGPVPDEVVDAVGVIEYPPGSRSWPIDLPAFISVGTFELSIPSVTCGSTSDGLSIRFDVASDGPAKSVR